MPSVQKFSSSLVISLCSFVFNSYLPILEPTGIINGALPAVTFGVDKLRHEAASYVSGSVLETCVGTALQSLFLDWSRISSYTGVDSSSEMLRLADIRLNSNAAASQVSYQLIQSDVSRIPLADSSFDTVIDTFSLCVTENPVQVVEEMKRLTKANGRIILLENTRSDVPILGLLQDISEPVITPLSKNCRWNTDIDHIAEQAELIVRHSQRGALGTLVLGVYEKKSI